MTAAQMAKGFDPHGTAEAVEVAVTVLKTLSHAGRLQILCYLLDGPMNVGALSEALAETQSSVSQHLMRLRAEGFVKADRQGKQVLYALSDPRIIPVIEALRAGYCNDTPTHP